MTCQRRNGSVPANSELRSLDRGLSTSVFHQDLHGAAADHAVGLGHLAGQVDVDNLVAPGADDAHGVPDDGALAAAAADALS